VLRQAQPREGQAVGRSSKLRERSIEAVAPAAAAKRNSPLQIDLGTAGHRRFRDNGKDDGAPQFGAEVSPRAVGNAAGYAASGAAQCEWWFTKKAVFSTRQAALHEPGRDAASDREGWKEFSPSWPSTVAPPVNGIVLTISAPV